MKIWDYVTPRKVAIGILVIGFSILIFGYFHQHPEGWNWNTFTSDFYANVSTELISIAITVLIIDNLNTHHENRSEKKRLILEMGSPDNGIALRAIQIMRQEHTYLTDGSLKMQSFWRANLNDAELYSVNLQSANFNYASMVGTQLYWANLKYVVFWRTNMEGAFLDDADLSNAVFTYANMRHAKVTREQLKMAYSLHGTILPNGKVYDGSFQLKGDIVDAQAFGVDINNPEALKKWYAMPYDELMRLIDLRKDKPELTDWGF